MNKHGVSLGRVDELVDHTGKEEDRRKWVVFWYSDRYGEGKVLPGVYSSPTEAQAALRREVDSGRASPLRNARERSLHYNKSLDDFEYR